MGDSHVGLLARLMSQALRKLVSSIARPTALSSSSTSCGKRWAWSTATRRSPPAAGH